MVNIPKAAAFSNCYTVQPVRRISGDFLPGNDPVFAAVLKTSDNGIIDFLKNEGLDLSYKKGKKTPALYAVDVFETETSRARYRVDE